MINSLLIIGLLLAQSAEEDVATPPTASAAEPQTVTVEATPLPDVLEVMDNVRLRFKGYVDLGAFDASGDGVGYVRDVGSVNYPEFADVPWVFMGDPWSRTVNSQGEAADLGLDRTNIPRFDPIASGGASSFIVNWINLGLHASVGHSLLIETSINFAPRDGSLGSPGDFIDIDLAYADWTPFESLDLHIFAGKFESTFGREYRFRKAPDRFGITPSLIARYTVGTQTGIKVRGTFSGLTVNAALTNGGPTTESFASFFNEVDDNAWKTVSGRVGYERTFDWGAFDIGASGFYGAQDGQTTSDVSHYQIGGDAKLVIHDFTLQAEIMRSRANERHAGELPWLKSDGGYAELTYQIVPWLGALVRGDFRKAHLFTSPNLYISDTKRGTIGLRSDLSFNVIAKVEWVQIFENSGPIDDAHVLAASFIFRY